MKITDELQKLSELHREGALSDAEFTAAKGRLLQVADGLAPHSEDVDVPSLHPELPTATYRSSRWSSGNLFFSDSLTLDEDGVIFRKGGMFRSSEEHISYGSIASVRVKRGLFLANLEVETSGGTQPIFINGLWKSDADRIQEGIRARQPRA